MKLGKARAKRYKIIYVGCANNGSLVKEVGKLYCTRGEKMEE
jgi:hypothetical protein